jgi:hypothetical protein
VAVRQNDSTPSAADPRLRRDDHRLFTGDEVEGNLAQATSKLADAGGRFATIVTLDAQVDVQLASVSACLNQIVNGGHPKSLARAALAYLARANEYDRCRDEQVTIVTGLVASALRCVQTVYGAVERFLVGRSRVNGEQP